ncbi:cell adhesion molecule CEACAM1-like isoform X1 [Rhinoraja longicauda]
MARLPPLTALALFLVVSTGVSLGFTVVPEHNNLNVRVGSDAILTVRPSAAIAGGSWSFKGTTIINWVGKTPLIHVDYSSRVKVSYTTGTLALETVTEQDSGDYIVTVNEQGTNIQASATIKLLALGGSLGLMVVAEHSNLYVRVGRDAIFAVRPSAAISGGSWSFKGRTIINWIGTGTLIHANYSSRVKISYTTGTLALETVTERDSGDYIVTVFAQGAGTQGTATVKLLALEPVSTPNITANASSFIEHNDTVVLTCLATGTNVSYTWIGDGSVIANGGRLELSAGNTTLTITGVLRSDGPFACRSSNPVSTETSQTFHLNVFYGPDLPIIIPDPNVPLYNSGIQLTLTCSAESEPTAQLEWYHQGDLVQSGAQLTFPNVSADDSGSYLCSAFNNVTGRFHASSIQINVQEPVADVKLHSNLSSAVENQHSVLLTCSSRGTHLRWEWLLNDQPVQHNDRITISRDTLLIDPVNRADAGNYKCSVSNGLNSGRALTTLHVYYGPDNMEITPRSPVNIKVGKDLILTCFAQSEPSPTYVWSKGTVQLLQGPEFTIYSVSKEDSGNYTCHVSNAELRSNNSLRAQVIVGAPSALPGTKFCLRPGAIAGIVVGLFAACLISGGCGWLIARKTSGPKATSGKKYNANGSPKGEETLAANAGNGSAAYENIQDIQQGRRTNAPIGDPTYMELKIEDRSVYDELKR